MWILIISLIVLALVAATVGIIRNRKLQKKIDRGELDAIARSAGSEFRMLRTA